MNVFEKRYRLPLGVSGSKFDCSWLEHMKQLCSYRVSISILHSKNQSQRAQEGKMPEILGQEREKKKCKKGKAKTRPRKCSLWVVEGK